MTPSYRFTAEDFKLYTAISDSPQDELTSDILTNLVAQAIADKANALLEKWEGESDKVTILNTGQVLCMHRVLTANLCEGAKKAVLWNPKED